MENNIENSISTKELFSEYDWYKNTFSSVIQEASDNFFTKNFKIEFIGLSKNINCLLNNESCFVTKVKIEKDYDMFFRLTEKTIEIILDKVLGKAKSRFNINKISELEAKIITAFNAFMYHALKEELNPPDPKELKRSNFDMINMTFILKDLDPEVKSAGKIIVTLPLSLLSPEQVTSSGEKFTKEDFNISEVIAKVIVGKTSFSLHELKNLEIGDVVVFENSNIERLRLSLLGAEMDINISPNMDLVTGQGINEGDENMAGAPNIWDSIEVDMNAEFDAVKITLKELKDIEEGLVVDLTSLYDNNVTLKVEGKSIASGSLVIVNDRYGVKIDKLIAKDGSLPKPSSQAQASDNQEETFEGNTNPEIGAESEEEPQMNNVPANEAQGESSSDEDFDYSDFELEDEGI